MVARRLAFATCSEHPQLTSDDRLALAPLAGLGISVEPVIWDAPAGDLDRFDGIIVRSCWDYDRKPAAFAAWIEGLRSRRARVWNPPAALAWNLDKRHLLDLQRRGVTIPDTRWIARGAFDPAMGLPSGPLVIKPSISLDGHDTYLFAEAERDAALAKAAELAGRGGVLVQAFVPEIRTQGEISLVFLGGAFSHAVRKLPRDGEFRIQVEYGGRREPCRPAPALVEQAAAIARTVEGPLLYVRVDGVEVDGRLVLMEIEAIDPMLFLAWDPEAPRRFAQAVSDFTERGL